jgi:hypothetical protein
MTQLYTRHAARRQIVGPTQGTGAMGTSWNPAKGKFREFLTLEVRRHHTERPGSSSMRNWFPSNLPPVAAPLRGLPPMRGHDWKSSPCSRSRYTDRD